VSSAHSDDAAAATVAVVIPVKGDAERLGWCLQRLKDQDYPGTVHVLVADNGTPDSSVADAAERFDVGYIAEPTPGSYAARNAALAMLPDDVEVVAFTDADCLPDAAWLSAAVPVALSGHVAAGRIEVRAHTPARPTLAEAWDVVRGLQQDVYVARGGWGATANLVVRRDVLDSVGRFESRLRSGGDAEWGRRATAAGVEVVYVPTAVVGHPARRTLRELVVKLRRVHEGVAQRSALTGEELPPRSKALLALRPPVGAIRIARVHPGLPGARAKVTFVVAEGVVRVLAAFVAATTPRPATPAPAAVDASNR
jgi:GT2 family glycosyltransferase